MAADGGLRRLFEKPLPENLTLLEALSAWNRVGHPKRAVDPASFTEIFGELHFQEKLPDHLVTALARAAILPPTPPPSFPPPPPRAATASTWLDVAEKSKDDSSLDALLRPLKPAPAVKRSASFSMKKSPSASSLLLCTEGLGSESTVDLVRDDDDDEDGLAAALRRRDVDDACTATLAGKDEEQQQAPPPPPSFPPPIRSISGRGGKPCVCFRSFREEGRFVLVQVVIPGKELLHASREGGRLRLQFASAAAASAAHA